MFFDFRAQVLWSMCLSQGERRTKNAILSKLTLLWVVFALAGILSPDAAHALPSFAVQTDQPCSACHVGSFGPQLKPFGRDFKLYGYTASDGKDHGVPLAVYVRNSFTNTAKTQPAGQYPEAVYGNSGNNNFGLEELSAWYAGKVNATTGAYIEGSFDGVGGQLHLDNADIRHIHEGKIFGTDYVAGITLNDAPTVSDIWNTTPVWGFPFDAPKMAPTPAASALIDGALQEAATGLGAYIMWNDWVYAEFDGYKGTSRTGLNMVGNTPVNDPINGNQDAYDGIMPYWRLAVQHELVKNHYFELGTYGIAASVYPNDNHTGGATDRITDTAVDATYQWLGDDKNFISAHSTFIHEHRDLTESAVINPGTNLSDNLNEFRADVSYSYDNTWTPTLQYFRTTGTSDAVEWNTSTGLASPNSAGFVAELAYVPFGKVDSPALSWMAYNSRLELQYTAYTEFDGTHAHASNNNTIFLDLAIVMAPKW